MADIGVASSSSSSSSSNSFVISIDDTSPTIVYTPFGDNYAAPNLTAGWSPYFSESGFATVPTTGQEGQGTSFHVTSADGAKLELRWNGTAVTLYGFFPISIPAFPSSISYSVSLDGVSTTNYASSFSTDPDSADNILAAFTNLTNIEHSVQLTVHNTAATFNDSILLRFDRAIITSEIPTFSQQQTKSQALTTVMFPDELIAYRGQWSFDSQLLPGQDLSFHTSTNVGDCATVQFNGTAVTLSGLTTPLSGSYNITIDNGPPRTFSARSSFNVSSPTLLFYSTGLDPNAVHQLSVVNVGASDNNAGSLLILGSVNVTTTVPETGGGATPVASMSSAKLPRGTIAAICVVVGVVVIAAITALIVFLLKRRREARRKESFIVNPNVSRRRFSFLTRSVQPDIEKLRHSRNRRRGSTDADIVDITQHKSDGDDDDLDDIHDQLQPPGTVDKPLGQRVRHASQNSDGSYSIDLPELPGNDRTRPRVEGDLPSPTLDYTTAAYNPAPRSSLPQTQSPLRSPKPKGPRDMRPVSHGKEGSRGILLKEMYSPTADVPTDVQANEPHPRISGIDPLPHPQVSPLRVNFEDEPSQEAERRREGRYRSGASGMSLPYSLKQALWGHIRSPADVTPPEVTLTDADGSQLPAYSFLDMESSASRSASTTSRNTRSTSTRSSSKSRILQTGGDSGFRPSIDVPPVPQDPRVSMGFSMTMDGGPTSSQPSNSPDISLHAITLSPLSIPDRPLPHRVDVPSTIQPSLPSEYQPSPTDSIPFTVSDIHFRHSVQSSASHVPDSRRASHRISGSHRGPHPPLPASPTSPPVDERPYIVQRLLGLQTGSAPSTPYGSPTISGFGASGSRWSRGRGSSLSGTWFKSRT